MWRQVQGMDDRGPRPLVLPHLGWPRDREQVGELLRTTGANVRPTPPSPELRRVLAEGRPDLVLADTKRGLGPLGDLRIARLGGLGLAMTGTTPTVTARFGEAAMPQDA
jgi:hypothetical protein